MLFLFNFSALNRPLEDSERLPVRTHRITSPQSENKEVEESKDVSFSVAACRNASFFVFNSN